MAEILRQTIQHSGETVAAISRGAGIAQPVLHRFMTGQRDLTLRTADKLLGYFDLELRPRLKRGG
jgi:plasmid maintenance system antidote protein VapI